jgi:hypothetical protein
VPVDVRAHELPRTRRFRVERVIGSGGMGVVYEAVDEERGGRVALKTLRTLEADSLLRFKNEFRRLQDVHHPNLVSLGELLEEDGRIFFTMELVYGVHLMQWVRPGWGARGEGQRASRRNDSSTLRMKEDSRGPVEAPWLVRSGDCFDETRLRESFGQLVKGLDALHRQGKVHRDVKPSNVLVTASGRVVIVDFGLILDVERDERDASIVGTAHYMAPEQAAGGPVGPEADWYGVGAMLYIALTGHYPFRAPPEQAVILKQKTEPIRPRDLVIEPLPADLEQLCVDLLRLDPAARPRAAQILAQLGVAPDAEPVVLAPPGFVGRTRELGALRAALADVRRAHPVAVQIEGESGVGKSALMRRFLDEITDAVVLYGRCYERESVPYKAVDEVIDALGRHLAKLPPRQAASLLPPDAALLGVAFPTLERIEALAQAASLRELPDPRESRARVFAALRELFHRMVERGRLVIAIDDLQWADADGLQLLAEVLRPPLAPALLFLATVRTNEADGPRRAAELPFPREMVRRLSLDRLPAEDARALAADLLARSEDQAAAVEVDALLGEAAGHPLFIDALLRHRLARAGSGPVRLDDALYARIARLDAPARRLLEVLAVAGRPLARSVAARAIGARLPALALIEAPLRAKNLARTGGAGPADPIEPYHDRIRETVLRHLAPDERRARHAAVARALEESGSRELEALAGHFREAGEHVRAARYAALAGDEAEQALAFDRAARLYRTALDLGPVTMGPQAAPNPGPPAAGPQGDAGRRALLVKLGDALANAGRGAEAAAAYLAAIEGEPAMGQGEALDLRRRAAENYLRSGYYDEGMACLRDVLSAVGMRVPRTPSAALAALLARRAQIRARGLAFDERAEAEVPEAALRRIDVCWSAALGLGMIDNVRGAVFQAQNLLLSLAAGEPYRIARALALEVPFASVPGISARGRALELLAEADALARRTGHPHALALVRLMSGTSYYLVGRFSEAIVELDRADVILRERCTGVAWERGSGRTIGIWCRWLTGDLREFCRLVPLAIREAEERGDRYLATNLRSYFTNAYWLVNGDVEGARREAALAIEGWSKAGFHLQHLHDMVARAQIALYEGDAAEAYRVLDESWSKLTASLSLRMQTARVYATHLRARTALARAASLTGRLAPLRREPFLREVRRAAEALDAERVAWATPLAASLYAGEATIRGDADRAVKALDRAARGFRANGMELFAAAMRRRLGELLGGDRGAALAGEAERWMRGQGVADPARITGMMAPGFR